MNNEMKSVNEFGIMAQDQGHLMSACADHGLMDIGQLSHYLHVPKATIYSWTFSKKVPYVKLGKSLRFDKKEIDDWIQARKVSPLLQ